jgi:hypothetical protein
MFSLVLNKPWEVIFRQILFLGFEVRLRVFGKGIEEGKKSFPVRSLRPQGR